MQLIVWLLGIFVTSLCVVRGQSRVDISDPCARAATQLHVGDIAYLPSLKALTGNGSDGDSEGEGGSHERDKRGATSSDNLLWSNGVVYYSFSSQFSESDKKLVYDAMRHWENHTCLRFQVRTRQFNFINFMKSSGCCSYVGRLGLGKQGLSLGTNCLTIPIILHEIGHALGFWHEHTRPDRDDYVDVHYSNILPEYLKNFEKLEDSVTFDLGVGYDYNSIMHYNEDFFARFPGTPTLTAKAGGIPIGQAVQLSPFDILQANLLYGCDDSSPPSSTLPTPPVTTTPELPYPCGSIMSEPAAVFHQVARATPSSATPSSATPSSATPSSATPSSATPSSATPSSANTQCAWIIRTGGTFIIILDFSHIFMEDSEWCKKASITVYEGTDNKGRLVGRICRSFSRYLHSFILHDNAFIQFHAEGPSNSTRSFNASYRITDVNECRSIAKCSHTCTNLYGGYTCSCRNGYYLSGDGRTCFDVNECALHNGGCSEVCTNTGGSYYCSCRSLGYFLLSDLKTCRRPGPTCHVANGNCMHICTELSTRRECSCRHGYQLQPDGQNCYDINECLYGSHNCQSVCENIPGSFLCRCTEGFHLREDNSTCAPDRVCHINNGECSQKCRSLGPDRGASCYCLRGYSLGKDRKTCEDINNCQERSNLCHHICINTNGSYKCECRRGYRLGSNGIGCRNIDECHEGLNECQFKDTCYDTLGSYLCRCPRGYTLAANGHNCSDIDECTSGYQHYCTQGCENTPGSYHCACRQGFILQSGWFCADVNECLSSHQCDIASGASCRNTRGSYTCMCPEEFKLDSSGVKCEVTSETTEIDILTSYTSPISPLESNSQYHYLPTRTPKAFTISSSSTNTYSENAYSNPITYPPTTPSYLTTSLPAVATTPSSFTTSHPSVATSPLSLTTSHPSVTTSPSPLTSSPPFVTSLKGCGEVFLDYSGTIATKNWPQTYPVNLDCEWIIQTPASNQILELSFHASAYGIAGTMPKCGKDWVKIIDYETNQTWGPFCGFDVPSNISVKTGEVVVKFHAGPKHGRARKGFSLEYKVWDACTPLPPPPELEGRFICNAVIVINEKFGPPSFPGYITSSANYKCLWIYVGRTQAKVKFLYFDLPESEGCRRDNVKLYGYRPRSVVATFCGNVSQDVTIGPYYSIELNIWPTNGTYRGFHARIN